MASYNTHNSIQWDALINAINNINTGGGGSSVTFDVLEKTKQSALNTNFTINGNFSDYDIIIIEMYAFSSAYQLDYWVGSTTLIASDLVNNAVATISGGQLDRYISIQFVDDSTYKINQASSGSMIYGIYGIKF